MTAETTLQESREAGAAVLEIERFEWAAPDRIELVGVWSGLRGRRFIRPTLVLEGEGEPKRLLAFGLLWGGFVATAAALLIQGVGGLVVGFTDRQSLSIVAPISATDAPARHALAPAAAAGSGPGVDRPGWRLARRAGRKR